MPPKVLPILADLLLGFLLGYVLATLAESFLHRNVQHASSRVRRFWLRYPRLFAPFLRAYYSHHTIHHARTFRHDYVTQFRDEREKQRVDREMPPEWAERIKGEDYGLTLKGWGVLLFLLPVLPAVPAVYFLLGPWVCAGTLLPLLVVYPLMSKWIHPLLHSPHDAAAGRTSALGRWLLKTRYMKAVVRGHYLHHRYINCNYNLLLGGDYLLGAHRRPGAGDLKEMARLGLPVD